MTERAPLSRKLSAIAESATLKVDAKAKALQAAGRPVISYAAGEPDFATPEHIVEAAAAAAHDVKNQVGIGEPIRDWFPISFMSTFTDWADVVHGPDRDWG